MIGVGGADRDRTDDLFNAIPYSTLPASVEPGKLEQRELSPVALLLSPLAEALPHYYQDPDFSPRLTEAFRSLPYSLAYPSSSSALRHEHPHREHDEISPRSDASLSLRAARTYLVSEHAAQVFPSP